jgi:hypothetical protein
MTIRHGAALAVLVLLLAGCTTTGTEPDPPAATLEPATGASVAGDSADPPAVPMRGISTVAA